MDITEAITEARENIVANYATEPCVVSALLSEIDRLSAQNAAQMGREVEMMRMVAELPDRIKAEMDRRGI